MPPHATPYHQYNPYYPYQPYHPYHSQIDPMDPTGEEGQKASQGTNNMGERMADSTASGPLWQQRPYPAPGKIVRPGSDTQQGPSMR